MPTSYHIQVTTDILVSTQAGKKLKKLTKHSNTAVALAAAATVAAWKASVTQEVAEQNGSAGAAPLDVPHNSARMNASCALFIILLVMRIYMCVLAPAARGQRMHRPVRSQSLGPLGHAQSAALSTVK